MSNVSSNDPKNKEEVREDFCPSCLVVPLAFAGAGATAAGSKGKNKRMKKALMISGILTILLAVLFGGYYLLFKKSCTQCSAPPALSFGKGRRH